MDWASWLQLSPVTVSDIVVYISCLCKFGEFFMLIINVVSFSMLIVMIVDTYLI